MNGSPTPPAASPKASAKLPRNVILLLAVAAVVAVVLALAFAQKGARVVPPPPPAPPALSPLPEADAKTQILEQVGTSSELGAIEQDLNATDLTGLDSELGSMEKELQ